MKPFRLVLLFSLVAFFLLFASACENITTPEAGEENRGATQTAGANPAYPKSPTEVLPGTGAEFDQLFIDMLVPYQQGLGIMSQDIQAQAQHPELKDFAAFQVKNQQVASERLLTLRERWYGSRETPALDQQPDLLGVILPGAQAGASASDPQTMIDRLRNASGSPDLAYIDAVIEHHQLLMAAAEMALTQGQHPETKQIAQELIDDYGREVERLMTWRTQWLSDFTPPSVPAPSLYLQGL